MIRKAGLARPICLNNLRIAKELLEVRTIHGPLEPCR